MPHREDDKRTQDEPNWSPPTSGTQEKRGSQNSAKNDNDVPVPIIFGEVDVSDVNMEDDLGDDVVDDDDNDGNIDNADKSPRSSKDKEKTRSFLDDMLDWDEVHGSSSSHVHFGEDKDKPAQQEVDEGGTWTTNSFTEMDNALDELTDPKQSSNAPKSDHDSHEHHHHHHHHHSPGHHHHPENPDLDTAKSSHQLLTKYLKTEATDEGTQSGISSWDWLSRLEQLLIHFFLTIFESKDDDSKLIIEMMPTEAGSQVEEIFQLLMKAEPDMYKDLGHLITLAENWLIHWRGDMEEKEKAVDFVRMYLKRVKGRNYYKLPIQVRLHKLGAFIAGLKNVSTGGQLETIKYPVFQESPPINQVRLRSPRVKPATHFSRVVANILSGMPCDEPLPVGGVYADSLGQKVFKNTLHGDGEFKAYTEAKYGDLFDKGADIFFRRFTDEPAPEAGGDVIQNPRYNCIVNANCWLPVYNRQYIDNLRGRGKCTAQAQADFSLAMARACQTGADLEKCKASKHGKHTQFDKLYEWVKGPDGKLYKKQVGSYADLGAASSVDSLFRRQGSRSQSPKKGRSRSKMGSSRSKRGRGYTSRATSDTRLTNKGQQTRNRQPSKPGFMNRNVGVGTSKDKLNNTNAYRGDTISVDASGDSGPDDGRGNRNKKGRKKNDPYANVGRGGSRSGNVGVKLTMKRPKTRSRMRAGDNRRDQQGRGYGGGGGRGPASKPPQQAQYPNAGTSRPRTARSPAPKSLGRSAAPRYSYMNRANRGSFDHYHKKSHTNVEHGWAQSQKPPRSPRGPQPQKRPYSRGPYVQRRPQPRRDLEPSRKVTYTVMGGEDWDGEGGRYRGGLTSDSDVNSAMKDSKFMSAEQKSMMAVNQCYEKAAKMLKKPSKLLVVPPAENLMLHLEQKFQGYKWGKGNPVALRKYPNGGVFVAQYANGGSRVYYPHGGLAVAISGPSPKTSHILVVRDPSDHIFFFDKALMASLNSSGKGTIFGDDGVVSAQYSTLGGFKFDNGGLEKGCRWLWNQGGQRLIMKLNKYMSIRMSDFDKIYLNFNGNRRGFLANVATGMEVSVMSSENRINPAMMELRNLIRPKPVDKEYDYGRGRYIPEPTLGFVDKEKHWGRYDDSDEDCPLGLTLPDPYAGCPNDPTSFFKRMFCSERRCMRDPNQAMTCHHRRFGGQRDDQWWQ